MISLILNSFVFVHNAKLDSRCTTRASRGIYVVQCTMCTSFRMLACSTLQHHLQKKQWGYHQCAFTMRFAAKLSSTQLIYRPVLVKNGNLISVQPKEYSHLHDSCCFGWLEGFGEGISRKPDCRCICLMGVAR